VTTTQPTTTTVSVTQTETTTITTSQATVSCGSVITANTTLCADIGPCSGNGLIIGASNITLDCADATISGRTGSTNVGINITGQSGVAVKNCVITGFSYGILIANSSHDFINNNTAIENGVDGFYLNATSNSTTLFQNTANGNGNYGYYDLSAGSGTAGTANSYLEDECSGNTNGGSSPSGLGTPQP